MFPVLYDWAWAQQNCRGHFCTLHLVGMVLLPALLEEKISFFFSSALIVGKNGLGSKEVLYIS